jgi:hypothetical protein
MIDKETGIWSIEVAKKKHRFDEPLCRAVFEEYSPENIADVGCGVGQYCKYFKDGGWPIVHGYEGTPDIRKIAMYDDVMVLDLTKRRWVGINYELILCLEVGEHIPKKYEQVFIDNVCEFVSKDLILSWAIPGQGGTGHFNEQPNEYVIEKFVKKGLVFDEGASIALRNAASLKWFRNTLMKFERGRRI